MRARRNYSVGYKYIYIYKYFKRKKDATTFSRQACFVNRFTLQGFKPLKSEAIHETGLSGKCSCVLFPLKIFIPLYFNVLSTVPRENRLADSLYIYIYILLTKREGCTGRISARGLDSTDRAQRGPYKKDRGLIFFQYGPEQAWLIRDLLHD